MAPTAVIVAIIVFVLLGTVLLALQLKGGDGAAQPAVWESVAEESATDSKVWRFRVAGGSHPTRNGNVDRVSIYRHLKSGANITTVREPENEFDFNAICFYLRPEGGGMLDIGFVPKKIASEIAPLLDRKADFEGKMEVRRYGRNGYFAQLWMELRMTHPPELKQRPKRSVVIRRCREVWEEEKKGTESLGAGPAN